MGQHKLTDIQISQGSGTLIPLRCPVCLAALEPKGDALDCETCDRQFRNEDGIADLRLNRQHYFAEFDREKMSGLLAAIPRESVRGALGKLLREPGTAPRLGEYILGSGRAGWKFHLPVGPEAVALDLGCGWGTLACSIADSCRHVVAMDSTLERMKFLQLRSREEGLDRLEFVCGGDGKHLPFAGNTFDLVIVNGVLEWVPCGSDDDPRVAQLKFLREIRRVLRDSGRLFLAIENRYSWKTWFRDPDGHSGLRFVTWLPRAIASGYSRLRGRGRFRNYLYGEKQLRSLLGEAGFSDAGFFVPLPGYHHPTSIVPLDNRRAIFSDVTNSAATGLQHLRRQARGFLDARFPGNFNVVASAANPRPGFLEKLLPHLDSKLSPPGAAGFVVEKYRINGEMGMVTIVIVSHDRRFVLKLPLDQRARRALDREVENLKAVADGSHPLSVVRQFLPRVGLQGEFDAQPFAVFHFVPGATGDRLIGRPEFAETLMARAADFLATLHQATAAVARPDSTTLADLAEANVALTKELAASSAQSAALERLGDRLVPAWRNTPWPIIAGHGDFKLANCVFDPRNGNLTGVIDWGAGFGPDAPLHDLSFLLVDRAMRCRGESLTAALTRWIEPGRIADEDRQQVKSMAERLGIPFSDESIWCLGAHQWLRRMIPLTEGYECRRFDYRYLDSMFAVIGAPR